MRRKNNINMGLRGRLRVGVDWIQLANNAREKRGFLKTVTNFRVP
jgi:hypothetical protein